MNRARFFITMSWVPRINKYGNLNLFPVLADHRAHASGGFDALSSSLLFLQFLEDFSPPIIIAVLRHLRRAVCIGAKLLSQILGERHGVS